MKWPSLSLRNTDSKAPLDYDPEANFHNDDSESDSQDGEDDIGATEHYVSVG